MRLSPVQLSRKILSPPRISYLGSTCRPGDVCKVLASWLRGEGLITGERVKELEESLSGYYDLAPVVAFGAGRMACYAILKAMKLKEGDEVILPGYNCVVIPNAIIRAGVRPVYADVSLEDYNILPEAAERLITPRTRAIILQHTFGLPCRMEEFADIGRRHGLPIIEDGAHSIGARYRGKLTGLLGVAAFFSTQQNKMITTMAGGYAVTTDPALAEALRSIQQSAADEDRRQTRLAVLRWCYDATVVRNRWSHRAFRLAEILAAAVPARFVRDFLFPWRERYVTEMKSGTYEPFPTRLPNMLARAGLLQLPRVEAEITHRNELASYLCRELPGLGARVPQYDPSICRPSWPRFAFVVQDRRPWCESLLGSGFIPGTWLEHPIHPLECNPQAVGYTPGSCPNAEYLGEHIINIPIDGRVTIKRLSRWLAKADAAVRR